MPTTTRRTLILAGLAALGVLAAAGCREGSAAGEQPGETMVATGVLKSGFVGIGGEHTGWMLKRDGKEPDLEADVSAVLARAKELDGTRVRASGAMYEKAYVERGTVQIFRIEALQPAPGSGS